MIQPIAILALGLVGIVLLSLIATVVAVWRYPDLPERMEATVRSIEELTARNPHPDGMPCEGDGCGQCARYVREVRRETLLLLRVLAGYAIVVPAGLLWAYGPRVGHWMLHGRR